MPECCALRLTVRLTMSVGIIPPESSPANCFAEVGRAPDIVTPLVAAMAVGEDRSLRAGEAPGEEGVGGAFRAVQRRHAGMVHNARQKPPGVNLRYERPSAVHDAHGVA